MINAQLREERSLHVDLGALVVAVVADSTARAAGLWTKAISSSG
jgi:hypothetical protein